MVLYELLIFVMGYSGIWKQELSYEAEKNGIYESGYYFLIVYGFISGELDQIVQAWIGFINSGVIWMRRRVFFCGNKRFVSIIRTFDLLILPKKGRPTNLGNPFFIWRKKSKNSYSNINLSRINIFSDHWIDVNGIFLVSKLCTYCSLTSSLNQYICPARGIFHLFSNLFCFSVFRFFAFSVWWL
jgi:hypothetical protein